MNEIERIPAVPAVLDQHLEGQEVEVIIRLPNGDEYYTRGTFRQADWNVEHVEVGLRGGRTEWIPTERHFHLHLVHVKTEVIS